MTVDDRPYFISRACDPAEHEFDVRADGSRYCTVCKFTEQSLRDVIKQDLESS